MNLNDIKKTYQANNTQFILIDNSGLILETDNVLFSLNCNTPLSNLHPFFENILQTHTKNTTSFSCVHLTYNTNSYVCDVDISTLDSSYILITIIDFSKHYKSFQSLAQSRNETAIAAEKLTLKHELLKEKEAFKTKFVDNFSHEIISPITSIVAFSNLLKSTKLNATQKEYLDVISSSSLHLKSMIRDVLDISKLNIGKLEVYNEKFNFDKLVSEIESEYSYKCGNKNLEFFINKDSSIPTYLESDKAKIKQIIKNLLDNAIKFTNVGSVTLNIKNVFSRAQKITLEFVVIDTGIGINKEHHELVFNRFNRAENTLNIEGVGLGLSIVKEITQLLNGSITLKSEPKVGSEFTARIKTKIVRQQEVKKIKKSTLLFNNSSSKRQILVVEDNELHQITIFKYLANSNSYYFDLVNNGVEALEALNKASYDIVLMDYKLPFLNGLETAKAIRNLNDKHKKNVPIIIMTGSHTDSELIRQLGKDINYIMPKPFEERQFLDMIKESTSNN